MTPVSSTLRSRRIVLASRPNGKPLHTDFRLEEAPVAEPGDGEMLLSVRYLSLDPYMRGRMDDRKSYSPPTPVGGVMEGEVVAEVIRSHHPDYHTGEMVLGRLGWLTHVVSDGAGLTKLDARFDPVTTALGVLGMPGFTAYTGLLNIGRPRPGETVVVAAASGPVGSLVGQIARIKGARAVGIAGGADKCCFVQDELGFDAVVDHRAGDFAQQLAKVCPKGIDVYFENVGGPVWQAVLPLLNKDARVPVCGLIAQYNDEHGAGPDRLAATMREVVSRSLTLRGFINTEFAAQRPAFLNDVSSWIADGRVLYREDVVMGLDRAPEAFIGMLEGRNFGKLLVDVTGTTR
ncbi:NADP-dependent oxidoreductase [Bradyrhizobium genosp. P]|uniref:NADP-dependent oxidoreductase n=1 Tax=Bradyrhizobium genosp. P TaxID=83641 RepID=UPI003CEDA383